MEVEYREHRTLVGLVCTCAANPDRIGPKAEVHIGCVMERLPDLRLVYLDQRLS